MPDFTAGPPSPTSQPRRNVQYRAFIAEIEALVAEEAKTKKKMPLAKRLKDLTLEIPDALVSWSMPVFDCGASRPSSPQLERPALTSIARRLHSLHGTISLLSTTFSIPDSTPLTIDGVSGLGNELRSSPTPLGRRAYDLSNGGRNAVVVKVQRLVLRPVVEALDFGGWVVRFEFVGGEFESEEPTRSSRPWSAARCVPAGIAI
ncbi:hypothetical protein JCM1840_007222 [Sporobolomyces johnsonii]